MALAEELEIELLFLPAYSPNLNLIERLWKLVKKECLYPDTMKTLLCFLKPSRHSLALWVIRITRNCARF